MPGRIASRFGPESFDAEHPANDLQLLDFVIEPADGRFLVLHLGQLLGAVLADRADDLEDFVPLIEAQLGQARLGFGRRLRPPRPPWGRCRGAAVRSRPPVLGVRVRMTPSDVRALPERWTRPVPPRASPRPDFSSFKVWQGVSLRFPRYRRSLRSPCRSGSPW